MSQQDMDLRGQVAMAIARYDWNNGLSANGTPGKHTMGEADAVLEVVLPLVESVEASRRDWAAEAERIDPPLATEDEVADIVAEFGNLNTFLTEQVTEKLFEFYDIHPKATRRAEPPGRYVCACLTAEQAAVVLAGGFCLPLCAVHPEADR